jgi:hypothetical protein
MVRWRTLEQPSENPEVASLPGLTLNRRSLTLIGHSLPSLGSMQYKAIQKRARK